MASDDRYDRALYREKYRCHYGCGCIGFIIAFSLFVSSIIKVQFTEYAFTRPWGQPLDQSIVYSQGIYFLGFWTDLVTFPSTIVDLELEDLNVFSLAQGDDAGTPLIIDVAIQYLLNPDYLSDLYDIGGEKGYINQIEAVSIDLIKNNATSFNADSYLTNRRNIEQVFFETVKTRVAEQFAETQVVNLQLLAVIFPSSFYRRKLDVGIQEIKNDIQGFNRETVKVREETARDVLLIQNDARRIVDVAKAESLLIEEKANNDFTLIVGSANELAARILAEAINVTEEKDFLSLNYLTQILVNPGKQKKFVNFDKLPEPTSLI